MVNRLFGIFFGFFYLTIIISSIIATTVIGRGFPELETSFNATEVDEIISKCGINQVDIEKSCGAGKIPDRILYMLMGIFR